MKKENENQETMMDEEIDEEIIKPQIIRDFEQLQKENEELQESVAELKDKNLRQLAEMDNIRKNALKQRQDYMKYKYEGIAGDLLGVLDNFDRCIKNIENESSKEEEDQKLRSFIAKRTELEGLLRKRDFCESCIKIMKESMQEILDECRMAIQEETFEIFNNLIWKEDAFSKVEILENYSFRLLDKYGNQTLGSCSAAETALLALSFTLALQDVSKHDALLFIDTPIGRVGTQNRTNFMNTLMEIAKNKQVILTFTTTEYDHNVQSIISNNYNSFHSLTMSEGVTTIKN